MHCLFQDLDSRLSISCSKERVFIPFHLFKLNQIIGVSCFRASDPGSLIN